MDLSWAQASTSCLSSMSQSFPVDCVLTLPIDSFHYWRLNPDQATSDPKKSPDPLAGLMATVEDDSKFANGKRNAERFSNGQLVGGEGGTVSRGNDMCNDSLA